MCHSLCGYRTQSTTIQISDKTFDSVKTENCIKNISLTIKKRGEGKRRKENLTELSLHTKITASLTSSAANEVCDQYDYHQTRQCTTHSYGNDVRRIKRTVFS